MRERERDREREGERDSKRTDTVIGILSLTTQKMRVKSRSWLCIKPFLLSQFTLCIDCAESISS